MTRKHFLALATLTLLVAAFLRIWQLAVYPPGPHYDEAAELLITRSIAFGGARFFPMVEAYQGREVLFYYLSAPFLSLIHDDIFTLRLLSVFCNLLTIAASVALGRAMFPGRRGMAVGLVIGVLMTLSFPMIWMSRQAFRSSALPLTQALALLLLWRGLKAAHARRFVPLLALGGLCAGAALYTYNSSRLFPLWLLLGGLALLLFDRHTWRLRLAQGAVFFGVLALVAAPMGLYALQRPEVFFGRLAEVTQPGQSVTLAESIGLHLKMFFLEGDPYFRYNEPGRPYFTFPEGLMLLLGIAVAARRLTRRQRPATERAAYLLALFAPLMVIPSVISVGGLPPSHMRSLGMVPLIFVLVAVGAEWVLGRFARATHGRSTTPSRLLTPLMVFTLLVGGLLVGSLYFRWAARAELYYESDADLAAAARWLVEQNVAPGTPVYLAARDKGHPTVLVEPVPPITWLGTDSLFRPAPGETGLYIFPHSAPPPPDWEAWLAPGEIGGLPLAPDGAPAFRAFRISGAAPLPLEQPAFAARNRFLTFVGLEASPIAAGEAGTISMGWQVDVPPAVDDLTPLLTLEDAQGSLIFRGEAYMAGTRGWRAGETLIQRLDIRVPPATPPGEYALRIAWVERSSDTYVSYLGEQGEQGVIWSEIGTLTVTRPAVFPDPLSLPINVRQESEAAPGVTLLGWDALPETLRPGETLPLTLYWRASGESRSAFTLRVLLRNDQGESLLWEGQPVANRYTAEQWANGEVLADHARWTIPREQQTGDYMLVLASDEAQIAVSAIRITGVARLFEPPPVAQRVGAELNGQVALYGISLTRENNTLSVEMIWQALQALSRDYKVFVHLVNQEGVILAQSDAMPQQDTYPTRLWLSGEYVPDTVQLPLPAAAYALRIGMYDPETGMRLNLVDAEGSVIGDYIEVIL